MSEWLCLGQIENVTSNSKFHTMTMFIVETRISTTFKKLVLYFPLKEIIHIFILSKEDLPPRGEVKILFFIYTPCEISAGCWGVGTFWGTLVRHKRRAQHAEILALKGNKRRAKNRLQFAKRRCCLRRLRRSLPRATSAAAESATPNTTPALCSFITLYISRCTCTAVAAASPIIVTIVLCATARTRCIFCSQNFERPISNSLPFPSLCVLARSLARTLRALIAPLLRAGVWVPYILGWSAWEISLLRQSECETPNLQLSFAYEMGSSLCSQVELYLPNCTQKGVCWIIILFPG